MSHIISSTTKFNHTASKQRRQLAQRQRLLDTAEMLQDTAWEHYRAGDYKQTVEFAYWAALRTAGAHSVTSAIGERKRKPKSVWDQLDLVDAGSKEWAAQFRPYSYMRRRVESGLAIEISQMQAFGLMKLVGSFRRFVLSAGGDDQQAA